MNLLNFKSGPLNWICECKNKILLRRINLGRKKIRKIWSVHIVVPSLKVNCTFSTCESRSFQKSSEPNLENRHWETDWLYSVSLLLLQQKHTIAAWSWGTQTSLLLYRRLWPISLQCLRCSVSRWGRPRQTRQVTFNEELGIDIFFCDLSPITCRCKADLAVHNQGCHEEI